MGILSTAGKIALGLATDHIKERGVKGTMEDLGKAASSVKDFFSSDDSSEDSPLVEYYELIDEGKYEEALDYLDNLYTNGGLGEVDTLYYCRRADAFISYYCNLSYDSEEVKEIEETISDLVRSADNLASDSYDREKIRDTRKSFEDARSEKRNIRTYFDNWIRFCDEFNDVIYKDTDEAQRLLDEYYNNNEDEKDFLYYKMRNEILWIECINCCDSNLQKQKQLIENSIIEIKDNLNFMRNTDGDNEDELNTQYDWVTALEIILIHIKCTILTDNKCFDEARSIAEKIKNIANNDDSLKEYYQILSRIESLRLLNAIEKKSTDSQTINNMIETSEKFKDLAVSYETDADTITNIKAAIDERVNKAKEYLASLGSSISQSNNSSTTKDAETEYITELKACLADDGEITDRERRLLDRLRKSLGISEARAKDLEAQLSQPSLTDNEKEYADELKACMEDGTISDREHRLLNKLRISLGISEERAKEIEAMI